MMCTSAQTAISVLWPIPAQCGIDISFRPAPDSPLALQREFGADASLDVT